MPFKTARIITQDVIKLIGLVSGTGVQTYTEPQVYAALQFQFDVLFIKRYWEWLTDWHSEPLSGVNGLLTNSIAAFCTDFNDIREIYITDTDRRVVRPVDREHLRLTTGSWPKYYVPLLWDDIQAPTRMVKFYPPSATGSVDIKCRTKPANFVPDSTVPFPDVVMTSAVSWHLLDNDGMNPTAASKAQTLYESCYSDLIANMGDDDIGQGSGINAPITIRTI